MRSDTTSKLQGAQRAEFSREGTRDCQTWIATRTVLSKNKTPSLLGLTKKAPSLPLERKSVNDCVSGFKFQMMSYFGTIAHGSLACQTLEIPQHTELRCTTTHNNPGSHRIGVPSRIVQSEIKFEWNKLRTLTRNVQQQSNEALIDNSVTTMDVSPAFCEPWCPFTHRHECRYHKLEIMGAHSIAVFLHSAGCYTVMRPTKRKRHATINVSP